MPRVIYENTLDKDSDIKDLSLEGAGEISFAEGAMKIVSAEDAVLWYVKPLPADVRIDWEFKPLSTSGVCQLHFAAKNADDRISEFLLSYYNRMTADDMSLYTMFSRPFLYREHV